MWCWGISFVHVPDNVNTSSFLASQFSKSFILSFDSDKGIITSLTVTVSDAQA